MQTIDFERVWSITLDTQNTDLERVISTYKLVPPVLHISHLEHAKYWFGTRLEDRLRDAIC
ncbi:hypothetical protein T11_10715 [Trichinella zimbabwensis]|uniref:Uncharacterized protein n=1 Tax=Trichinella zimbabwensis TaxID=268475 RepID=A0A0V1GT29_9BILA|nr:hypothetical protein T11_10715 [Trichinella zimbabwensis]